LVNFKFNDISSVISRDWSPKFATGLNMIIGCSSKRIWVIKLSFCQNDPLMGESFWQNNSLVTHILFELQSIVIFSLVANFGDQSLHNLKANNISVNDMTDKNYGQKKKSNRQFLSWTAKALIFKLKDWCNLFAVLNL